MQPLQSKEPLHSKNTFAYVYISEMSNLEVYQSNVCHLKCFLGMSMYLEKTTLPQWLSNMVEL